MSVNVRTCKSYTYCTWTQHQASHLSTHMNDTETGLVNEEEADDPGEDFLTESSEVLD